MRQIDIIIPTRNRWAKLSRCLKSIPREIPDVILNVIVICDGDCETAQKLIISSDGLVHQVLFVQEQRGSVFCRNLATQCAEDAVLYATDDIEFKPHAIETAVKSMAEHFPDEDGIVGFNQIGKQGFSKSGVALVGQKFLRRYPNRKLFCPQYFHFSCQEIERLGDKLNRIVLEEDASLIHYHPGWNLAEMDKTHNEARIYRDRDLGLSSERRAKGLIWGDENKLGFIDIGELTWGLYLSAHLRWLKENTDYSLAVITLPDRKCLYRGSADLVLDVPHDFHKKYGKVEQNCFGLHLLRRGELREYFQELLPSGYAIPENFIFNCNLDFLLNKTIYKPYEYSKKLEGKEKILIFPRYRKHPDFSYANLPKSFYIELIEILCDEFPDYEVKTIGLDSGSYNINEIKKNNYINGVKENANLQDMIDGCQLAIATIGGISSLPRISLLQKVPTFIIGIQKKRFTEDENWLKTKVGFHEITKESFPKFDLKKCKDEIMEFLKGDKGEEVGL